MHAVYEPPLWITQETSRANPDFHHGLLASRPRTRKKQTCERNRRCTALPSNGSYSLTFQKMQRNSLLSSNLRSLDHPQLPSSHWTDEKQGARKAVTRDVSSSQCTHRSVLHSLFSERVA